MKKLLLALALLLSLNVTNASFGVKKEKASSEQSAVNPAGNDVSKQIENNSKQVMLKQRLSNGS